MKTVVYLLVILLSIQTVCAQYENDTIIYWSKNRVLQWNDFQGSTCISCNNIYAETHTATPIIGDWKDGIPTFKVFCYFKKKTSWKRDTSFLLLSHEQLHFDITELYARKIRKAINYLNEEFITDLNVYMETINNILVNQNKEGDEYDRDTQHGIIKKQQEEWNKKISKELEDLKEYEVDYAEYREE